MNKILPVMLLVLTASSAIHAERPLDEISVESGTDKGSNWHGYTSLYEELFEGMRHEPIKFLEIGLLVGNSARMWEEYFPNAELHAVDISPAYVESYRREGRRTHCHVCDQSSPKDLQELARKAGGNFDIIIDDGGHQMNQQITSFRELWSHVKPGGWYVIEDIFTSYLKEDARPHCPFYYGGGGSSDAPKAGPGTAIQMVLELVHELNEVPARTYAGSYERCPDDIKTKLSGFAQTIESIRFAPGVCAIKKRA